MPKQATLKLSPITLPQIYYYLSDLLSRDVAGHIFSLQPGTNILSKQIDFSKKKDESVFRSFFKHLDPIMKRINFGHCLTVEFLRRNLLYAKISICDIRDNDGDTVLYNIAHGFPDEVKMFLELAGNEVWKLLTTQTKYMRTALLQAAQYNKPIIVKLLLDAAGDKAKDLINMKQYTKTAFDQAPPKVQKVMLQYLQK